MSKKYEFEYIGKVRTPYKDKAPYQPQDKAEGKFVIELDPDFEKGLQELKKFKYIYVIYHLNKIIKKTKMLVIPPWAGDKVVGVFASRSPVRPNNIGLSNI